MKHIKGIYKYISPFSLHPSSPLSAPHLFAGISSLSYPRPDYPISKPSDENHLTHRGLQVYVVLRMNAAHLKSIINDFHW